MTTANRIWPLLTAMHRYETTLSTRGRGAGVMIDAPVLAYLIETPNGRLLYDVGCDYQKLADPALRAMYYEANAFPAPKMTAEQRIPAYLARLGLTAADIDLVFVGHLHFDHSGGLCDFPGCEVHVQLAEVQAAGSGEDAAVFTDELQGPRNWRMRNGEYTVTPGVQAVSTPGHTAGHMSMWIELPQGPPVILCGDAADLQENLHDEVAPGLLWHDGEAQALASIRKLKGLAAKEGAELWPNHDIEFYRTLPPFPAWRD
jgi:N-acyl homoserine lactone hydrolase